MASVNCAISVDGVSITLEVDSCLRGAGKRVKRNGTS